MNVVSIIEVEQEASAYTLVKPIIELVCDQLIVTEKELMGMNRYRRFVEARQIVGWFARRYTNLSLQAIGNVVGNRDHTTVLYGIRNIDRLMLSSDWMKKTIDKLDIEIKKKLMIES